MAGINDFWDNARKTLLSGPRELTNFLGDAYDFLGGRPNNGYNQGVGDRVFGTPGDKPTIVGGPLKQGAGTRGGRNMSLNRPSTSAPDPFAALNSQTPSYQDALAQAQSILGQYGGGFDPISYDPLRQDAQNRAGEYDAKLAAMFNELQGGIKQSGEDLSKVYDQSIADTAARSEKTQSQIQGAGSAADQHNLENLLALGLGDAAANIVAGGRDINSQTAQGVSEAAARGQTAQDQLGAHQQAAATNSSDLVNAAGFAGTEQRGRVQDELSSLLANYAMQEQQANQSASQQAQSNLFGLAGNLLSNDWQTQNYQDDLSKYLYEQQQSAQQAAADAENQRAPYTPQMSTDFIAQLMQQTGLKGDDLNDLLSQQQMAKKILGY